MAEALRVSGLTHGADDSRDATVDIDLPDPETWETTWDRTKQIVSTQVDKVQRDAALARVDTISVFAIGPIPTLVLLGYQLDDKTSVKIFAPSRRDDDSRWMWPEITDSTPKFDTRITDGDSSDSTEILLTVGITAPVRLEELPPRLAAMPRVEVTPEDTFGPNVLSTHDALEAFATAWRDAFARVEAAFPKLLTIHLVAVAPAVAAIEIGRSYMRDAQPKVIVYQRQREKFVAAIMLE
nr:SAVED domain-containing protein [Cryobacterium sp. BB736]